MSATDETPGTGSGARGRDAEDRSPAPSEVTRLLAEWREGDEGAFRRLVPVVYAELQRIARLALRGESPGHTLQTTALVHEAYLRLAGTDVEWESSRHFRAVAARAMRRILVDHARRRSARKRGGGEPVLRLDSLEGVVAGDARPGAFLDLDAALERLFELDERKARTVELHYFAGLSYEEVADALEISPTTVFRDLSLAKAWLYRELDPERERGDA